MVVSGLLSSCSVIIYIILRAQTEAGHHLFSDAEKARDAVCVNMMNNINHVTSGKFLLSFILYSYLCYICNLPFFWFLFIAIDSFVLESAEENPQTLLARIRKF
jgi:hypothetical protein